MASNSIVIQYGDASTTEFNFSFTGGYMSPSDVLVRVGDEVDGAGQPVHRSYTFINPGRIKVGGAVPRNNEEVKIYRRTPIQTAVNDFANGSILDSAALDRGFEQLLKATQEVHDATNSADGAATSANNADVAMKNAQLAAASAQADRTKAIDARAGAEAASAAAIAAKVGAVSAADEANRKLTSVNAAKTSVDTSAAQVAADRVAVATHRQDALAASTSAKSSEQSAASDAVKADASEKSAEAHMKAARAAVNGRYDPDAVKILEYIDADLTVGHALTLHSTVMRLKAAGIWNNLDLFGLDLGISEQAALVNWKQPSVSVTNNGAVYARGHGFKGNGTNAYIDTNVGPASAGARYTRNSAHVSVWVDGTYAAANTREFGYGSGTSSMYLTTYSNSSAVSSRINDMAAHNKIVPTAQGLTGHNRSGASSRTIYKDGVSVSTNTQASVDTSDKTWTVLRGGTTFSDKRVLSWSAGSSLTAAQWATLYTIINDARQGIALQPDALLKNYTTRTKSQTVTPVSGDLHVNWANGAYAMVPLTANVTSVSLSGIPSDVSQVHFLFTQDSTGGRTVTFPAAWKTPGGGPAPSPSTLAGDMTHVVASTFDGGTTWYLSQGETWA